MTARRPSSLLAVRIFLVVLAALLLGYMFLGRGFAHLGVPPLYVGEVVLAIGIIATAISALRTGIPAPTRILWILGAFLLLGVLRTVPYIGEYGVDALRDAVLWGYGLFAVMVYLVADRSVVRDGMRLYGWVVPVFAIWLPICWFLFGIVSSSIDPTRPGEVIPLIFFKSGDMAVHIAGSVAFLVFGSAVGFISRAFFVRMLVAVPLAWTALIGFATNRGSLVALACAVAVAFLLRRHWRTWSPLFAGGILGIAIFMLPAVVPGAPGEGAATPRPSASAQASPEPSRRPTPANVPPPPEGGRPRTVGQVLENFVSIFVPTGDDNLSGTRAFRLAWWGEIVDYTAFGPYFWTGKGFGINLATADGFQPTADHSLRAPHNSHMSVLARMGVPGFALWIALQAAFAITLLRATLAHRRAGDTLLAAAGAWILVYWVAIMVNTSFDPYIEGPQGGIWFWTLIGLGMVVARLRPSQYSA
ncbi:MAG TPA: O-antigen ligase family protein [Candidatus Limnocylindria bacterium]|nr:O-antigen ligase family protein [Candidatus Limnocylindria bacterium]